MIVCIDVGYKGDRARAAGVVFQDWMDATPSREITLDIEHVESYVPGQFYLRELPCAMAVLKEIAATDVVPSLIIVDGYVWLSADGKKGLGAHLHDALDQRIPVGGVAKNKFRMANNALEIRRGSSDRPLFITAVGIDPVIASQNVQQMHGRHRIPTLFARVDQLSRSASAVGG